MPGKSKAQKQLKIGIVESWLRGVAKSEAACPMLECTGDAAQIRDAFLQKLSKQKGRVARADPKAQEREPRQSMQAATVDKLDDLADCLLQGVTWIQWERNRQAMSASLDRVSSAQETGATHNPSGEKRNSVTKSKRAKIKGA